MLLKKEYVEYLLSTPFNYTCTNLADHKSSVSHDAVSDFLRRERFTPGQLWQIVEPHLDDTDQSVVIVDDSVQDKRYSRFIELAKKQYSGNEGGIVKGIGIVNLVHSSGNEGDFFPIDYRICHPDTDGKTKNDHFRQMFTRLVTHKHLKARTLLFDTWYASVENLKLIHRHGWVFFTTLKSNRKVSLNRESGYQSLDSLDLDGQTWAGGVSVRLKEVPFLVKLFKLLAPRHRCPRTATLTGWSPTTQTRP